jgi:hypothetical protein
VETQPGLICLDGDLSRALVNIRVKCWALLEQMHNWQLLKKELFIIPTNHQVETRQWVFLTFYFNKNLLNSIFLPSTRVSESFHDVSRQIPKYAIHYIYSFSECRAWDKVYVQWHWNRDGTRMWIETRDEYHNSFSTALRKIPTAFHSTFHSSWTVYVLTWTAQSYTAIFNGPLSK